MNNAIFLSSQILFLFSLGLQGEGGRFRRAPSWRKKFRNKDRSKDGGDDVETGTEPADQESPQGHRKPVGSGSAQQLRTTETMRNF